MICTCDNCHYTFEMEELPSSCPDCGKETVNRRMGNRILSTPAVRAATDAEVAWYEETQKDLQTEDELESLREQMTVDEYNWSLIMQSEHQPKTKDAKAATAEYLRSIRQDPGRAAEIYPTIKRLFTSKVTKEREYLKTQEVAEPHGDISALELADVYGPALKTLYRFKSDRNIPSFLLGPPNLGNVRRIDLEKIARDPSPAYTQFLLCWEKLLRG